MRDAFWNIKSVFCSIKIAKFADILYRYGKHRSSMWDWAVEMEADMSLVEQFGMQQKSLFGTNFCTKQLRGEKETGPKKSGMNKKADASQTAKTSGNATWNTVELSDRARALLEELQQKYSNMDFLVADYESEEEAQAILARGTKEYSVLIDPETLEAMAADEDTKNKYLGIIDDARNQLSQMMDDLGEDGDEVTRVGITIHDDGTVSYFAEMEQLSEKQKERIQAAREEKKAEQKEQEKQAKEQQREEWLQSQGKDSRVGLWHRDYRTPFSDMAKRTTVQADTVEGLKEAIRSVDWGSLKTSQFRQAGGHFDASF